MINCWGLVMKESAVIPCRSEYCSLTLDQIEQLFFVKKFHMNEDPSMHRTIF